MRFSCDSDSGTISQRIKNNNNLHVKCSNEKRQHTNVSKEMETLRKTLKEMLNMKKHTARETKIALNGDD